MVNAEHPISFGRHGNVFIYFGVESNFRKAATFGGFCIRLVGTADGSPGDPGNSAAKCGRCETKGNTRCAGKSGHGNYYVSEVQWTRTESTAQVVRSWTCNKVASCSHLT